MLNLDYIGHDIGVILKESPGTLSGEMMTLCDTLYRKERERRMKLCQRFSV